VKTSRAERALVKEHTSYGDLSGCPVLGVSWDRRFESRSGLGYMSVLLVSSVRSSNEWNVPVFYTPPQRKMFFWNNVKKFCLCASLPPEWLNGFCSSSVV
jgi:hypothetical protein